MSKRSYFVIFSGILAILLGYGLYKENNVHSAIRSAEIHKIEIFNKIKKESTTPVNLKEATIKDWHQLFWR